MHITFLNKSFLNKNKNKCFYMHKGSMVYVQNINLNKNMKQSKMTTLTSLCLRHYVSKTFLKKKMDDLFDIVFLNSLRLVKP